MTIKVDLLPEEQRKASMDWSIIVYFLLLAGVLAGLLWYSSNLQGQILAMEEKISEKKAELDEIKKNIPIIQETKDRIAELEAQYEQIKGLKNDPRRYANLLQEITMLMPDTVWWDKVSINPATKSMEFSGSSAEILGALPLSTIANYMRDIHESSYFSNPVMSTASESDTEGVRGFGFSLTFGYNSELAAQQDPPSLSTTPLETILPEDDSVVEEPVVTEEVVVEETVEGGQE